MEVMRVYNLAGDELVVHVTDTACWQTDVKAAVACAWHVAPLCQQFLCGALLLDGTEGFYEVFADEDVRLYLLVSTVELSKRLLEGKISLQEEQELLEMARYNAGSCREVLVCVLIGHLSDQVSTRCCAIVMLSKLSMGCEDLVFDAVQNYMDDESLSVREAAVVALANLVENERSARSVIALAAQQGNASYRVRVRVYREMDRVLDKGNVHHAIEATAKLLENVDFFVRREAAARIAKLSENAGEVALAAVSQRVHHHDAGVRQWAAVALELVLAQNA
uniref:Uncharacterized protein n=1 Tax=Noctiluca scintillans TaxID=2966 RepID=A0A7S1A2K7_NOCSC|mmetsp:Transcript_29353/g.77574  ORF Transcript_29353/g.77574 Transcript_29353/m.77574 type:complete len:279 (+) Transcript_29353:13-849(+)